MVTGREIKTTTSNATLLQILNFGDFAFAVASAQKALKQRPSDGKLWHLLGFAYLQLGNNQAAEAALRRASELVPLDAEVREHLAVVWRRLAALAIDESSNAIKAGSFALAVRHARRAISLDPRHAGGHGNLAVALRGLGRLAEAIDSCRQAIALAPQVVELHNNMGSFLADSMQLEAATQSFREALQLNPQYVQAHLNLGLALIGLARLDEAMVHLRRALELEPQNADIHNNLAYALQCQGRLDEAESCYRRAMALAPDNAIVHSSRLFCLLHNEKLAPAEVFAAHLAFGLQFEPPAAAHRLPHTNPREPDRRLRLGFVSGDLRNHSVAGFIEPVWAALDSARIELWVYSNHAIEDQVTQRLRLLSQHWRKVVGLPDTDLAAQIRSDGIDVLFDLSGHTACNRLLCFAQKPAPLQVTWVGYPNTTGLQAMDYVLCDRFNAPHGLYEHFYVEKFARLPSSGTFALHANSPEVSPLPALSNGFLTFGSFNRADKLGPQVLSVWARVLHGVPKARLLLGNVSDPSLVQRLSADFAQRGIEPERLLFRPTMALIDYLALHHEVDIILDSWPYTGGTTTNYALSMGVPVVTLQGPARMHCQSAAVLGRTGLPDWVAHDVDEFVAITVKWSQALAELAHLRANLRERWQTSPLRQPALVAGGLEQAVRVMWQRWCAGLPPEHFEIEQPAVQGLPEVELI